MFVCYMIVLYVALVLAAELSQQRVPSVARDEMQIIVRIHIRGEIKLCDCVCDVRCLRVRF